MIACVFLPFAGACYLTYLFRTISALISGRLMADLSLGAADLGLITSVYFLTLAASQIPVGVWLDRYGPRRVQGSLFLVAAAGAGLFSVSRAFIPLLIARALIGFGVAAALTAGLKAIVQWFPKERVAAVNGYMTMLGALGAVTATLPAERLIDWVGWRGLFVLLAVATAVSAIIIFLVVPEPAASPVKGSAPANLKDVYTDPRFWRLAPLSATCVGAAWALGGLWAAPWLTDVEGLDRTSLITQLFAMAVAASLGALLLGTLTQRVRRYGVGVQTLFALLAALFVAAQLALILRLPVPSVLPWSLVAVVGAGTVLSYAIIGEYVPSELAGRANGALNVFHFGWAFVVQYAVGLILDQWSRRNGHYPAIAYQVAFGLNVVLQALALAWFAAPRLRALVTRLVSRLPAGCTKYGNRCPPVTGYDRAMRMWAEWLTSIQTQKRSWRLAALGTGSVCVALGLALAVTSSRAELTPHLVKVDRLNEVRPPDSAIAAPSDAQIAYFLRRFVKNVRSLSSDPIVVRSNWTDALDYVTARGAQTLSDYARDGKPFMKLGRQTVSVDVISVIRASNSSFEIYWQEQTYQYGIMIKSERYTGMAEIVFRPIKPAELLHNPLGMSVNAFSWSRETVATTPG